LVVIVIAGMPGAGKEEFVQVAIKRGYDVVRMGDVVRAEAARLDVVKSDKGVGGFANEERRLHGFDIWAKRAVSHVKNARTVIDGSRGLMELEVFRKDLSAETMLLAIHSSPQTRYGRLRVRGRFDAPKDWKEFQERDERELGWGLGSLIAMADRLIINEGTLEEFKSRCAQCIDSIEEHEIQSG
jgi:dephospho-CoA kinase